MLRQVAEIAGERAALALAAEWGGREIYIPQTLPSDHRLVRLLGHAAATAIIRELGYGKLLVPLGPLPPSNRNPTAIRRLIADGRSLADIATATGCHIRTVTKHRAKMRAERLARS